MSDEENTTLPEENTETRNENSETDADAKTASASEIASQNIPHASEHDELDVRRTANDVRTESESAEDTDDAQKPAKPATDSLPYRNLKPGMVVRVHEVIKDLNAKGEERERVQVFEGTVLGLNSSGIGRTITVRKESSGIGVEKIYPLASPHVRDIEVVKQFRVRRAKLWYLKRDKKKRRLKEIPLET